MFSKELLDHYKNLSKERISDLYTKDKNRFKNLSIKAAGLILDFSKNLITNETIDLLCDLAKDSGVKEKTAALFCGKKINITENRSVLHTALRDLNPEKNLIIDNVDITTLVNNSLKKIGEYVEKIHASNFTDIVNIGIGGSDLGPNMVVEALKPYINKNLKFHFVSNVDSTNIAETIKNLNPKTTLFIVASKTFTTQETLCNAETARDWLFENIPHITKKDITKDHFIAVTANPERASQFGILENNIYPFWDFVGGRFSLWSAIGLVIAIAIGMDNFYELLAGAHEMDQHFYETPYPKNLPVILALLSIWNINFLKCTSEAVIPYDQYLNLFPAYLQQLAMESNGKSVNLDGKEINYKTAPITWGGVGTNGQHAYHQLLMQGTELIPVDFILPLTSHNPIGNHHLLLAANCFAQSEALMLGKSKNEVLEELLASGLNKEAAEKLAPHKVIAGNRPSNLILMEKLTPRTLGALIALYEHKTFVLGTIWNINSFDQWGVELGKKIGIKIADVLTNGQTPEGLTHGSAPTTHESTRNLIKLYWNAQATP